ncbi:MAG: menaquinone biosynthesis protein [Bacteroidota bacterium]
MKSKIKVTAVSYLNTKPFLYGIFNHGLEEELDLELNIPSVCAQKLRDGEVDLGLVPVAIIPQLIRPHIISDYCIGTVGAVKTVCLYSHCPLEAISSIYLDYHSRTSAALLQLLLREYWHLHPQLLEATPGYIDQIQGTVAGLVIGDRTIGLEKRFPYVYDLGEVWEAHTGLPFVFAAWVSNKALAPDFIDRFNRALAAGLAHIPQLIYLLPKPEADFDLPAYFNQHISYELDDPKRLALDRFLKALGVQDPVEGLLV